MEVDGKFDREPTVLSGDVTYDGIESAGDQSDQDQPGEDLPNNRNFRVCGNRRHVY